MEQSAATHGVEPHNAAPDQSPGIGVTRKRSTSGAGGLLSKFPFMRSSSDHHRPRSRASADESTPEDQPNFTSPTRGPSASMANVLQQQQVKTRRRRGSLRKVALLGRGAQRERRESRTLSLETKHAIAQSLMGSAPDTTELSTSPSSLGDGDGTPVGSTRMEYGAGYGLGISEGISDVTPRPSMDGYASRSALAASALIPSGSPTPISRAEGGGQAPPAPGPISIPMEPPRQGIGTDTILTSPTINYSTTDDEDALHMSDVLRPSTPSALRPERSSRSSGSELYFPGPSTPGSSSLPYAPTSIQRRRSATTQRAKSPLALTALAGLSAAPIPQQEGDWDYSETEWWGWVVLIVTWVVFVIGMGSCLGVWSWAWDVGTTPYAPPELEDDPTLPIVGYYPALIILTSVMAWVWVVVAWVGMKYFRHARVSGD